MKTPRLFALTKREQRVVIAIVFALLMGTVATHYRDLHAHVAPPPTTSATNAPIDREDDAAAADDSR